MKPPADFNNKAATADAVIALSGKSFPVGRLNPSTNAGVFFRIEGSAGQICRGAIEAETALDVVIKAADDCGYTYKIQDTSFGPYLIRIANDKAEGLKGWLYRVDGVLPSIGAADFALWGGEGVLWYFG